MTIKPRMRSSSRDKNASLNCCDKNNNGKGTENKPNIKYLFNKSSNIYDDKLRKPGNNIGNVITTRTSSPKSTPAIYKTLSNDTFSLNNRKKFKKSILTLPKLEPVAPIYPKINKHEPSHNKYKKVEKIFSKKQEVDSNKSCVKLNNTNSTKKITKNCNIKAVKRNSLGDVWTILKNINSFRVLPSPVISEISFTITKKKINTSKRASDEKSSHKMDREIKVIYSPESAASSSITGVVANTKFRRKFFNQDRVPKKINKVSKLEDVKDGYRLKSGGRQNIVPNNTNKIKTRLQPAVNSISEVMNQEKPKSSSIFLKQTAKSVKESGASYTLTEIRRKLGLIKFPLTILGKDQLSSTVKVEKVQFPQFFGLTKHIWPFMKSWSIAVQKSQEIIKTAKCFNGFTVRNCPKVAEVRQLDKNKLKQNNYFNINVKVEKKDQIFRTLKNKAAVNNLINSDYKEVKKAELAVGGTKMIMAVGDNMYMKQKRSKNEEIVDDIINKIKQGFYFNDIKVSKRKQSDKHGKGANVKTDQQLAAKNKIKEEVGAERPAEFNRELLLSIPGFGKNFSDLLIEEMTDKKVVVKNSRTKTSLEFILDKFMYDFSDCHSSISSPNVYSFPLYVSKGKIPESLCSMLPSVLQSIYDFNNPSENFVQKDLLQEYHSKQSNADLKLKRRCSKF